MLKYDRRTDDDEAVIIEGGLFQEQSLFNIGFLVGLGFCCACMVFGAFIGLIVGLVYLLTS